jgi:hypothetical protein
MKPARLLAATCVATFLLIHAHSLTYAAQPANPESTANFDPQTDGLRSAETVAVIPGPLRSFLRMAGISQAISPSDVLPLLARNVFLQGYQSGRAMEFLILLRRYVRQANELNVLAGTRGKIQVNGCQDVAPLLHVLGYKILGECGSHGMSLMTADAERAFLTTDSGFPLMDLEEALQQNHGFALDHAGSSVPLLFESRDWLPILAQNGRKHEDVVEGLLYEPEVARLYWALSRIDPETRVRLKTDLGLAKLLPMAAAIDLYGTELCVRAGTVIVPGGRDAERQWQDLVGASPRTPSEFVPQLLRKDHGWLAAYFDALARTSQKQQEHFASGQRIKRFYIGLRSLGTSDDATRRMAFRPAPALLVLAMRLKWDSNGEPFIPGNLEVWSDILRQKKNAKFVHDLSKRSRTWHHPDQLVEAMFALSRIETEEGPTQIYLCLSELDHRRDPQQRLSNQTLKLLAENYSEFSDQYMLFSEFPELNDASISSFLNAAKALSRVSNPALRGNAMGIFQANVGLWQILARQGQIARAKLNPSWQAAIQPFTKFSTGTQLFTAGRSSVEAVVQAATGRKGFSQEAFIDLVAGVRQTTPEGQRIYKETADRIRAVLEDQRLISAETLFILDDALRDPTQAINHKEELVSLAGELREFEMPRPMFSSSERAQWAAGMYNNRHTDIEMRTDVAKIIQSDASPKQREEARGQLAIFLRDTLVGVNYAYYEPPGSQVLHNNPLFVRSHDFSGESFVGFERLWQSGQLFGAGSPAGGGAHVIGSLADLPYVLAEAEQDFIAPDHVQALIWQQFVPGLLSNAIVPRWWAVSRNELHAVALYQQAGEDLLKGSSNDAELGGVVAGILSDRMSPEHLAWLEQMIAAGKTNEVLDSILPADSFYLTAEFSQRFPGRLTSISNAGRELETLSAHDPDEVNWRRLSQDFGAVHPVLAQTYAREFLNLKPFPALGGTYSRLMGECWDSGNLYWARLADEMGYAPVMLNRLVPELTHRVVERIFASHLEDWRAILLALRETGEEFKQGKISSGAEVAGGENRAP